MNTNRACGCKAFRSCFVCEAQLGIAGSEAASVRLDQCGDRVFDYCIQCAQAVRGQREDANAHSHSEAHSFPGILIVKDFVSEEEETQLVTDLDSMPWDTSQSGRRKQNFGPRTNFKQKKAKLGAFRGFPATTEFVQARFSSLSCLHSFRTVEQCSIEYQPETGSCIEPHIDDCWVWGERVVQLNLLQDSVLTCFPYQGNDKEYNLDDVSSYPRVLNDHGEVSTGLKAYSRSKMCAAEVLAGSAVRIPLPRRSLLVMYGQARYDWEHSILRKDIVGRRVVLAYREFTPTYLTGGSEEALGSGILAKAANFWTE